MSAVLDDGLRVITRDGGAVPFEYVVSEDGTLTVESAFASFDGSAAAAYLPCIAFYSQSGALLGRYFPTTGALAAGASADVSFAPFLGDGAGASTGIQFDVFNQTGGFLDVKAVTGSITLEEYDGAGIYLFSEDAASSGGFIGITTSPDGAVFTEAYIITERVHGQYEVQDGGAAPFFILNTAHAMYLKLGVGRAMQVTNHVNTPIFEVREDGSIHGRAAVGAITWDL